MEENRMVSIIIPTYNLENYVQKCITSIQNQTYKDLDIIFVDDGSTDHTKAIIEEATKNDLRIRLFDGQHKGVSNARNIGLDHAKGEYISFIDGDDFVSEQYINTLLEWMDSSNADITIGGTIDVNENYEPIKVSSGQVSSVENRNIFLKNIVLCQTYTCVVWGKLYKKTVIGDIRFNTNIEIAEDFEFLYQVSKNIQKVYYNTMPLYNWLLREKSSLHTAKCTQVIKSLKTHEMILEEIDGDSELIQAIVDGYVNMSLECMKLAKIEHNSEIKKQCKEKIWQKLRLYIGSRNVSFKQKAKTIVKLLIY